MVNWKSLILLLILLFSSFTLVLPFATGTQSDSNVIFSDDFDRTQVDALKWVVVENTNMSGYPAWGGAINVKAGQIAFSSNGSTFPWVRTLNNPFPSVGDFAVEFSLTYKIIGDSGNGVRIFSNQQNPNVYDSANNIFTLWAHDEGETTGVILIELFNKVVYKDYVPGFKPTSPVHTYRLEYVKGNYTVYVDNRAVASMASQIRPTAIGLGHPPIPTLPYPPETTQTWAYWGWTSFSLDSIKVTALLPNENSLEPTNLSLTVNAALQIGLQFEVTGKLGSKNMVLPSQNIILSYNVPGTETWTPITSTTTDNEGAFSAFWIPTATGVFTIKAQYLGNTVYEGSQDCKNISVTQNDGNSVFLVESNSTLSAIMFNSASNEASFNVSGPSGTYGYIRCIIPKTLLPNPNLLNVHLDGNKTAYSITELSEGSWLLYLTYSHSSHTIMLGMQTLPQTDFTVYGVIVAAAILGLLAAGVIVFARNLNK